MDFTKTRQVATVRDLDEAEPLIEIDQWSRQPFSVHVVPDATVIGGSFPICALDRASHIVVLSETSDYAPWTPPWSDAAFADGDNARVVDELDEACCLALPHNYCHWHQEALPKICILERMGFRGCYVSADVPLFLDSLDLIGIERSRIRPLGRGSLRVRRLYVPQPLPLANGSLFPMALWDARARCLEGADRGSTATRLFISRSQQTHRHIIGEDAFLDELAKHDFVAVRMEELSLRQQIGLASSAKIVMGPHGAGMASCLFMQQHGHVLELFSPAYINSCVLPICRLLDLSYNQIVSQVNPVGGYPHGENILPEMDLIRFYLERCLA